MDKYDYSQYKDDSYHGSRDEAIQRKVWHPLRHTLALPKSIKSQFTDYQGIRVVAKYPSKFTHCERDGPDEFDVSEQAEWFPSEFRLYLVPHNGSGEHQFVAELNGPLYTHGDHNTLYQHLQDKVVPSLLEILSNISSN
ncbi:MAG: hypothetical protein Q7S55_01800 [Nanoarchaeota archaeon]|nr:hypothetical protein [Nanoarchaeota archaeon]